MAFLLAAILVLAPLSVLFIAGDLPGWAGIRAHQPAAAQVSPVVTPRHDLPVVATAADEPAGCESEGLLARRLMTGEIDRAAYHDAMAELAVRDARNRPLRIPGDPTD